MITGKIHALVIPKYGMVMTEGVLAAWHIEEGREIKPGDEIIDIETEKIAGTLEAAGAGMETGFIFPPVPRRASAYGSSRRRGWPGAFP